MKKTRNIVSRVTYFFPEETEELDLKPDTPSEENKPSPNASEDVETIKAERDKYKKGFLALKEKSKKGKESVSVENEELKKSAERIAALEAQLKKMEEDRENEELKTKDQKDQELFGANKKIRELQIEVEKLKAEISERDAKLNDSSSKYSTQMEKLRKESLASDIAKYADLYKAIRPYQIVDLTENKFVWDDDLEKWIYPIRNKKGEIIDGKDVEEYVKEFMTDPQNDNLVRAGIKGGTGEEPKTGSDGKPLSSVPPITPSGKGKIVITDRIKKDAAMRDMKVEDWVALLEERQTMLASKRR